jgi:hypothetical protein
VSGHDGCWGRWGTHGLLDGSDGGAVLGGRLVLVAVLLGSGRTCVVEVVTLPALEWHGFRRGGSYPCWSVFG